MQQRGHFFEIFRLRVKTSLTKMRISSICEENASEKRTQRLYKKRRCWEKSTNSSKYLRAILAIRASRSCFFEGSL